MQPAWLPAGLGVVAFGSTLFLLVQVIRARQERSGRPSRLLRASPVPGGVPAVAAAVVGATVAGLAQAWTLGAVVSVGVVVTC